ncbi:MAG: RDD family protein, partial [Opitutaceae bacterium]|nr:RDD family protein [Opitutaceae bacterium]
AAGAPDPLPPGFAVAWADGQVLPWAVRDGRLEIWTLKPAGVMPLAFADEAPETAGVVGLDGLGRAAVLWPQAPTRPAPQESAPGGPEGSPAAGRGLAAEAPKFMYSEVSAYTGRQMFIGSARRDPLLSPRDFQVLSLVFGSLMIVVLLFVLRSDARKELSLPAGAALAPPGMRVLAGAMDLLPALGLAGLLTGVAPAKLLSLVVLTSPFSLTPLVLATLGLVIGHCALSEWRWGRSLGKALVGCRVAPASAWDRVDGRLRLWQTLARNAVRWVFPPLGMLMLFDPNFRHPGDVLARTVVVIPPDDGPNEPDEQNESEGPDGREPEERNN